MKIDPAVRNETVYIASFVAVLSLLMEAVWLVLGHFVPAAAWTYRVPLGNLLGASAAVLNFFLMALTVQKAVGLEPDAAKRKVAVSQALRYLMLLAVLLLAVLLDCFSLIATILPLFFPRIAIPFRNRFGHTTK